jgi:tetratricopeptide (TPR) repeat protein
VPHLYNTKIARFFYNQSLVFDGKDGKPEPYIYYQLARIDFIEGKLDDSLTKLHKELEVYPENTHTYYILGLTLGYMNKEKDAIAAFTHYIDTHPATWAGRNDKAWLQFRVGDIDGALTTIKPAYEMYPENPWVLNTYGVLQMNKKNYKEAQRALSKGSLIAERLTEESWGKAYPGNDPRIYSTGLQAMKSSFAENLQTVNNVIASQKSSQ